jgi:co-chaperonin GroES (HSP10)
MEQVKANEIEVVNDIVLIERLGEKQNQVGKIIVTDEHMSNSRARRAKILDMGEVALENTDGIKVGDTVLYDHLAVFGGDHYFGLNSPLSILRVDSIIAIINEDETPQISPIGDRLLCKEQFDEAPVSGMVIPDNLKDSDRFIKVVKTGSTFNESYNIKEGDEVLSMCDGETKITAKDNEDYIIIEKENILAKKRK